MAATNHMRFATNKGLVKMLQLKDGFIPDWEYMEKYIKFSPIRR
jgi:hypothetical protein